MTLDLDKSRESSLLAETIPEFQDIPQTPDVPQPSDVSEDCEVIVPCKTSAADARSYPRLGWLGGSVVERRSLTGELLLVCTGLAADG